jgi:hypothetical protein
VDDFRPTRVSKISCGERLFDFEQVVMRGLTLLTGGKEKISSRLRFPQIEIDGYFFPVAVAICGSDALSHEIIAFLIASYSGRARQSPNLAY